MISNFFFLVSVGVEERGREEEIKVIGPLWAVRQPIHLKKKSQLTIKSYHSYLLRWQHRVCPSIFHLHRSVRSVQLPWRIQSFLSHICIAKMGKNRYKIMLKFGISNFHTYRLIIDKLMSTRSTRLSPVDVNGCPTRTNWSVLSVRHNRYLPMMP